MAEKPAHKSSTEARSAHRQIIARGVVATALVVALLAGLLIYDKEERAPEPAPVVHAVSGTAKPVAPASVPASAPAIPEDVKNAIQDSPVDTPPVSVSAPVPAVPVAAAPKRSVPEETRDPTVPLESEPVRNATPSKADHVVVDQALKAPVFRAPAPEAKPAVTPANANFVVQLGVFNNVANAEELRARLSLAGVPSQLETRVQVGPFKTRVEALQAQEKLRRMGLGAGMLQSVHKH